jgi:hypothetical protein
MLFWVNLYDTSGIIKNFYHNQYKSEIIYSRYSFVKNVFAGLCAEPISCNADIKNKEDADDFRSTPNFKD